MMREVERCRAALELARDGDEVALVCSGDAGVYGMASPALELGADFPDVDIEVVCGVTAAQSGSAVLGAPLAQDFAVISLSDLLTPWEASRRPPGATSASPCTTRAVKSARATWLAPCRFCCGTKGPIRCAVGCA